MASCGGGESQTKASAEDKEACGLWNELQADQPSNAVAAVRLNRIASTATNLQVINRANSLAILLEKGATSTEIRVGIEDVDAACLALGQ